MSHTHPDRRYLTAYALGEASDGVALALSAHMTYCPSCRAEARRIEEAAGALLSAVEPAGGPVDLDALMTRLDEVERDRLAPKPSAGPLPRQVADAIGVDFDDIRWRFRLPGVSEYVLSDGESETVSLLRVRPGATIPQHTHKAEELTVVFQGVLEDGEAAFRAGDIQIADGEVHHHPRAGGDETCICLAVLTGGLTFTGRFGRALNWLS